jgi:hypothetical protein
MVIVYDEDMTRWSLQWRRAEEPKRVPGCLSLRIVAQTVDALGDVQWIRWMLAAQKPQKLDPAHDRIRILLLMRRKRGLSAPSASYRVSRLRRSPHNSQANIEDTRLDYPTHSFCAIVSLHFYSSSERAGGDRHLVSSGIRSS